MDLSLISPGFTGLVVWLHHVNRHAKLFSLFCIDLTETDIRRNVNSYQHKFVFYTNGFLLNAAPITSYRTLSDLRICRLPACIGACLNCVDSFRAYCFVASWLLLFVFIGWLFKCVRMKLEVILYISHIELYRILEWRCVNNWSYVKQ